MILATDHGSRPVGTASRISWFITVCCTVDLVSTVGDSPLTVMVSSSWPTSSWIVSVAVNPALIAMPLRSTDLNPAISSFTL